MVIAKSRQCLDAQEYYGPSMDRIVGDSITESKEGLSKYFPDKIRNFEITMELSSREPAELLMILSYMVGTRFGSRPFSYTFNTFS